MDNKELVVAANSRLLNDRDPSVIDEHFGPLYIQHDATGEHKLEFYAAALQPKELVLLDAGHYELYLSGRGWEAATDTAARWFFQHPAGAEQSAAA